MSIAEQDQEEGVEAPRFASPWRVWTTLVASVLGLGVSVYLTLAHFTTAVSLTCPATSKVINCEKVTTSPESYIFHIPVSLLGLFFFVPMVVLSLPRAWNVTNRFVAPARLALVVVGIIFVFHLLYAELFDVKAICLWCSSVHLLTFIIFVVVVTGWDDATAARYARSPRSAASGRAVRAVLKRRAAAVPLSAGERRSRAVSRSAIALVALLGLALRFWLLGRAPIDADAALVGLMAREILHGHFFAFYWGQHYGGLEPYAVAAMFFLFGQSSFTLAFTAVCLYATACVLTWRVGVRLFSPGIGVAAGLLMWVWPEVDLWQSTIEHGFRLATLVCGLGALLCALRISAGLSRSVRKRRLDAALFGACVGLGFWASPEIADHLLPAGALLTWRFVKRRFSLTWSEVCAAVVTAVLGALPWLYANVPHGFPSLRSAPQPGSGNPFTYHLRIFVTHVLPMMVGLRLRGFGRWLVPVSLGDAAYALFVIGIVVWVAYLGMKRRALVLVAAAVLFPLLYAYSPFTWYWDDGRYAIYLAPIEALLIMSALSFVGAALREHLPTSARLHGGAFAALGMVVALCCGISLTLFATTKLNPYEPTTFRPLDRTGWFSWRANPTSFAVTMSKTLEDAGVHDVYAGYWVAYLLSFESNGGLVASDVRYDRYPPYLRAVERATRSAWIFADPDHLPAARALTSSSVLDPGCAAQSDPCLSPSELESYLQHQHDAYRVLSISFFLAVLPERPVHPDAVFERFSIPQTT